MHLIMTRLSDEHLEGCAFHTHPDWEIIISLRGRALLQVGEREIPFDEGVIACLPPDVPHCVKGLPDYQDIFLQVRDFVPPGREEVPIFRDDGEKRFLTLTRMLYQSFFSGEENSGPFSAALLEAIYQLLVGWSMGGIRDGRVAALVREMIFHIPHADFDISAYIQRSGYCADHFRRCFKREMGKTPTAYMIALRLDHARRLLDLPNQGGYTIKQIAHMSGFSDPYYFSILFKKEIGCSPAQYGRVAKEKRNI